MKHQMRTRIFTQMINREVEDYLKRSDIIFIPVGVVEAAGIMPLDTEYILPAGFGLRMAEEADGLLLPNLSYFFSGGTSIGRGTVQMGIVDGAQYLEQIALSLLKQGFRRQVYITAHGPGYISVSTLVRDFFEKYKVPIMHINMHKAWELVDETNFFKPGANMDNLIDMQYACYDIMGKLEEIPVDLPDEDSDLPPEVLERSRYYSKMSNRLNRFSHVFGGCGFYQPTLATHSFASTPTAETRAERAVRGRVLVDKVIAAMDVPGMMADLREMDEFTQDLISRYPQLNK